MIKLERWRLWRFGYTCGMMWKTNEWAFRHEMWGYQICFVIYDTIESFLRHKEQKKRSRLALCSLFATEATMMLSRVHPVLLYTFVRFLNAPFSLHAPLLKYKQRPPDPSRISNLLELPSQFNSANKNLLPWFRLIASMADFESVAQSHHIRVRRLHHLESTRHDTDRPCVDTWGLTSFEAEMEVAGVFCIEAECVDWTARVGFGVGS